MGRKDDAFPRETLAERVANTRARQAERAPDRPGAQPSVSAAGEPWRMGHGTTGFHRTPPAASAAWVSLTPVPRPPATPPPPIRHAWYLHPDHGRLPAIILRWRHSGDPRHYDGSICTVVPDETGAWCLTELWVDAGLLAPA